MDVVHYFLSFLAGVIDSIAGGGGLITIPTISMIKGLGVETIATNKVAGTVAAAVALAVYARGGHFRISQGLIFSVVVGLSSFLGSFLSPWIPTWIFPLLLFGSAPVILFLVWRKEVWRKVAVEGSGLPSQGGLLAAAFLTGLYDGVWGPGGGTFMLLGLLFIGRLPLMSSIAISKFANMLSAGGSLVGYSTQGLVDWRVGIGMAIPIGVGALLGASFASRKAEVLVRPVLTIVVVLLLLKTYWDLSH